MKRLLVLCGGKSAEHEISLKTAKNILKALDRTKFIPIVVAVSRSGTWYYIENESFLDTVDKIDDVYDIDSIASLVKFPAYACLSTQHGLAIPIDVALSTLHGPNGEDGTVQGVFELCAIPYVGSGVLASAAAMDKDIFKQILFFHNIPTTPSITLTPLDIRPSYAEVVQALDSDVLFVKPSCMGSSVGVSKVKSAATFDAALDEAFDYSPNILIEKAINCREIECAVLGNLAPKAAVLGEICPAHEFYSYEAKYIDPDGAKLIIPAMVNEETTKKIQDLAIQTFKAIGCRGLARVDFFLSSEDEIYVNELNTFPGFTNISMYPKLWEESGISYPNLISELIDLAYDAHAIKADLKVSY